MTGLPTEYAFTSVSRSHGRVRPASAHPPQTSTTTRWSTTMQHAAPSSPMSKFAANASRTAVNAASHAPPTTVTGDRGLPFREDAGFRRADTRDVADRVDAGEACLQRARVHGDPSVFGHA